MAVSEDLINFDFDFDFISDDSFDQYFNNDNNSFDDKLESNLVLNSLIPILNSNYPLNPIPNQYNEYDQDIINQLTDDRLDLSLVSTSVENRFDTTSKNAFIESPHTFVDQYYHIQSRTEDSICGSLPLPSIGYGLQSNHNLNQNNQTNEPLGNGSNVLENLIQPVAQFDGQLLTAEEFQKNEPELFCMERMEDSPQNNGTNEMQVSVIRPKLREELVISGPDVEDSKVDINNNSDINNNNTIYSNHKTYSRRKNFNSIEPMTNNTDPEVEDAVKSLVMLSNYRHTFIRPKTKKGVKCQLTFSERLRQKRERNRIAAKKCRQKKLETIANLEEMKDKLMDENQEFETYLQTQRQRLTDLKLFVLKHRLTDCQIQDLRHN